MDVLELFLGLATAPDAEGAVPSSELYSAYVEMYGFIRRQPLSVALFSRCMTEKGFTRSSA